MYRICKVPGCFDKVNERNKYTHLCEPHRYAWYRYKSYEKPKKPPLPEGIIHVCKTHGELTKDECMFNRYSEKGRIYWRCNICRNKAERDRLNKTKYSINPKKHIKQKLPPFVKAEDRSHAYTMLHRFKVTAVQYKEMQDKQNNLCAICHKPETIISKRCNKPKKLCIDHCHATGKIRALLCHHCNVALGNFRDSIENLESAIKYLKIYSPFLSSHAESDVYEDHLKD